MTSLWNLRLCECESLTGRRESYFSCKSGRSGFFIYNFRYSLNGKYELLTSFDDEYTVNMAALNFQGGSYKKIVEKSFGSFCTNVYNESIREYFENFQNYQKYQVPWKSCPYPDGPNEINDYVVEDYGKLLPPYIPGSEKWKIEVRFSKENETIGGYNLYGIIRTEKSLLGN